MQSVKEWFHHYFIPRESNNHRAGILHHRSLFILIAAILLSQVFMTLGERKYPAVLGISYSITPEELLTLTNQKRQDAGLPPLKMNSELANAAAGKAQDMFIKNYWAHVSPDGVTPWVFIKGAGYEYMYAGENLARGFTTATDVMNAWMASPGHRENILSKNYSDIGFAIKSGTLTGDDTVLVVEEFGSRASDIAQRDTSVAAAGEPIPVSITPVPKTQGAVTIPTPTQGPEPTAVFKPVMPQPAIEHAPLVASVNNQPLINTKSVTRNISLFLIALLIIVLSLDLWVVEKRNIVRAVAHNADHIIFLTLIFIAVILFSSGFIL